MTKTYAEVITGVLLFTRSEIELYIYMATNTEGPSLLTRLVKRAKEFKWGKRKGESLNLLMLASVGELFPEACYYAYLRGAGSGGERAVDECASKYAIPSFALIEGEGVGNTDGTSRNPPSPSLPPRPSKVHEAVRFSQSSIQRVQHVPVTLALLRTDKSPDLRPRVPLLVVCIGALKSKGTLLLEPCPVSIFRAGTVRLVDINGDYDCASCIVRDVDPNLSIEVHGDDENDQLDAANINKDSGPVLLRKATVATPPHFLSSCKGAISIVLPELSPHLAFREVGFRFVADCRSLSSINLAPLTFVTIIGNDFMRECSNLSEVDLGPLVRVQSIGSGMFARCTTLKFLDTRPLAASLTNLGQCFLTGCTSLEGIDLGGLSNLERIAHDFLQGCSSLESINLEPLRKNVQLVMWGFLCNCHSLGHVDFRPLAHVNWAGGDQDMFLRGCANLNTIVLDDNTTVASVSECISCWPEIKRLHREKGAMRER